MAQARINVGKDELFKILSSMAYAENAWERVDIKNYTLPSSCCSEDTKEVYKPVSKDRFEEVSRIFLSHYILRSRMHFSVINTTLVHFYLNVNRM